MIVEINTVRMIQFKITKAHAERVILIACSTSRLIRLCIWLDLSHWLMRWLTDCLIDWLTQAAAAEQSRAAHVAALHFASWRRARPKNIHANLYIRIYKYIYWVLLLLTLLYCCCFWLGQQSSNMRRHLLLAISFTVFCQQTRRLQRPLLSQSPSLSLSEACTAAPCLALARRGRQMSNENCT